MCAMCGGIKLFFKNVRWQKKKKIEALPVRSKRCRLLAIVLEKSLFMAQKFQVCRVLNTVAANEEGIKEVLKRRD